LFLQFTPAYGFAFLQSGILPRTVFHKPPGRKSRCGKRTQTVVFHTGKARDFCTLLCALHSGEKTILNALRFALRIHSGKDIL